jgi:hypothetical protein
MSSLALADFDFTDEDTRPNAVTLQEWRAAAAANRNEPLDLGFDEPTIEQPPENHDVAIEAWLDRQAALGHRLHRLQSHLYARKAARDEHTLRVARVADALAELAGETYRVLLVARRPRFAALVAADSPLFRFGYESLGYALNVADIVERALLGSDANSTATTAKKPPMQFFAQYSSIHVRALIQPRADDIGRELVRNDARGEHSVDLRAAVESVMGALLWLNWIASA